MSTQEFEKKTKELIDALKSVCANHGLGNDGNEFKIITQVFLYKFLNEQIRFLEVLKNFMIDRGHVTKKDLVSAPFTQLHPKGILGVFQPNKIPLVS